MIREYTIYLRDLLLVHNNGYGDMFLRLNEFIETDEIEDLMRAKIKIGKSYSTKIGILNSMADSLRYFFVKHYLAQSVLSYEEFIVDRRDLKIDEVIDRGAE